MKIKSMRENLRESHMLKDYLEKYPQSRARVLLEQRGNPAVTYEPMRNYLDVSVAGSRAPECPWIFCQALWPLWKTPNQGWSS